MSGNLPPGVTQNEIDRYFGGEDDTYDCDHEEYEIDVCTGRAECQMCGKRWWASNEQVDAELDRIAAYDEWCRKEHRREQWRKMTFWLRWPAYKLLSKIWPRKSLCVLDDEIPF